MLERTYYYGFARHAFREMIYSIGVDRIDRILVPDYLCDVMIAEDIRSEATFQTYRMSFDVFPEINLSRSRLSRDKIVLCLVVAYFGFLWHEEEFINWADDHNILLVLDSSHGLVAPKNPEKFFASIYSLRKIYSIPTGASLHFYCEESFNSLISSPAGKNISIGIKFSKMLKTLLRNSKFFCLYKIRNYKKIDFSNPRAIVDCEVNLDKMDIFSFAWLWIAKAKKKSIENHLLRRWHIVNELLESLGLRCVRADGLPSSPIYACAICSSTEERDGMLNLLHNMGYLASTWPQLPEYEICNKGNAYGLWEKTICVSLHDICPKK